MQSGHDQRGSFAGRLLRRLAPLGGGVESCSVCERPVTVDGHCVRLGDAVMHAQCALYRRRPARA